MLKINRDNYEAFIMDYMEGNLSPSQEDEFLKFMDANPDIKEEMLEWEEVKINPPRDIYFQKKEILKKTNTIFPDESPFEEHCIAKLEGDLTKNEALLFDKYIKKEPERAQTFKLYSKTKLTPNYSIFFSEKEKSTQAKDRVH